MMFTIKGLTVFIIMILLSGCRTAPSVQGEGETGQDVQEALSAVAGALSGKKLSEEDLKNLEKQIRTDEEAQTAIQAITGSVGGQAPVVKYCPITGERYAAHMEYCPEHNVKLEIVEP
ncbi:MAG: hypothetical protein KAR32_14395 [Candidatus Omnitrophica bacterium]|nr:hypothetical protein [Candidatus Omnitrophota bacterium]MCK5259699.1 hypothetical protein [Candidatus Omnitrophota bacterium]